MDLNYNHFIESVKRQVSEDAGNDVCVRVSSIYKNNILPVDGLTILRKGENVAPAIYLNPYFEQYESGASVEQIAEQILEYHRKNSKTGHFDVSFYTDYQSVQPRLACRLINQARNQLLLREVPYSEFFDLAIVYYYQFETNVFGNSSILIKNDHLKMWNVSKEKLHEDALKNTLRLSPCVFTDIMELIEDMMDADMDLMHEEQDIPMYVLSNECKNYGAVTMLFPEVQKAIVNKVGGDFYVLPSSIHECIVIPAVKETSPIELHEMVKEINEDQVEEEEILSDSVYLYRVQKSRLERVY